MGAGVGEAQPIELNCHRSLLEQFRVRARPNEGDDIALKTVNEQEVAANMALAVVSPVSPEGVV